MPTDRKKKAAARALAARTGWSYTAALRRLDAPDRPFDMMTVGGGPCPPGCTEAKHPGLACWTWRPEDAKASSWQVRQWAALPSGRAGQVAEQSREVIYGADPHRHARAGYSRDHWWLLALIYCMLTDEHPELVPDPEELRAAVEADDLAAVHAVMDPLDRAAARVATKDTDQWWKGLKPRLEAYVAVVAADDSIPYTWIEIEQGARKWKLVERWHRAWKPYTDYYGYPAVNGVTWGGPKTDLDIALTSRHGGHAPGTQVRLDDGRLALVCAAEWDQAGPPTGYWISDLEPNPHVPGQLRVAWKTEGRLVPAAVCRPEAD